MQKWIIRNWQNILKIVYNIRPHAHTFSVGLVVASLILEYVALSAHENTNDPFENCTFSARKIASRISINKYVQFGCIYAFAGCRECPKLLTVNIRLLIYENVRNSWLCIIWMNPKFTTYLINAIFGGIYFAGQQYFFSFVRYTPSSFVAVLFFFAVSDCFEFHFFSSSFGSHVSARLVNDRHTHFGSINS